MIDYCFYRCCRRRPKSISLHCMSKSNGIVCQSIFITVIIYQQALAIRFTFRWKSFRFDGVYSYSWMVECLFVLASDYEFNFHMNWNLIKAVCGDVCVQCSSIGFSSCLYEMDSRRRWVSAFRFIQPRRVVSNSREKIDNVCTTYTESKELRKRVFSIA